MSTRFTLAAILQSGRLEYEAVLLAASLARAEPDRDYALVFLEPQPGPLWRHDPRARNPEVLAFLRACGATIQPFQSRRFGDAYPHGNKIEALRALPDRPFVFFDTDTLFMGPLRDVAFDFDRPSASLRREGTWPKTGGSGPGHAEIWQALYARFGLDFAASLDLNHGEDDWRRYLYFNAGVFWHRSPQEFGGLWEEMAHGIWTDPPPALRDQKLVPWLDQVSLPLVIHALGGGRHGPPVGIDGDISCHYRTLPLLYAREADAVVAALEDVAASAKVKRILQRYPAAQEMIFRGRGQQCGRFCRYAAAL